MGSSSSAGRGVPGASPSHFTPAASNPTPAVSARVSVAPSGETIVAQFFDASNAPAPVIAYDPLSSAGVLVGGASGAFKLSFGGQTTAPIPVYAPASMPGGASGVGTVQAALEALPGVGAGNVKVTGLSPYVVTFVGALAGATTSPVTVDVTGVSATAPLPPLTAGATPEVDQPASGANFSYVGSGWHGGYNGFLVAATGTSQNLATHTFPGLAAGWYKVYAAVPSAQATDSTSTPYRLFDGPTYRGTYRVNQSAPGAFPQGSLVAPVYVASGTLEVVVSDDVLAADVGLNVYANTVSVVPFNPPAASTVGVDDPLFALVPPFGGGTFPDEWFGSTNTSLAWDPSGHYRFFPRTNTITPRATASWTFEGVLPGTYAVEVDWPIDDAQQGPGVAGVVYAVSDGGALLGTVTVNQGVAAAGATYTNPGGHPVAFFPLGTFACASGSLTVTMTPPGGTAGTDIIALADAARLTLRSASATFRTEAVGGAVAPLSSGPPVISVDGGAAVPLTSAVWAASAYTAAPVNPPLPYILFPIGRTIGPNSVVTFTLSQGVVTTAAGPFPGTSAQAVVNTSGGSFLPLPRPGPRTMGLGFNLSGPGNVTPNPVFANWIKAVDGIGGATLNPDGYPLTNQYVPPSNVYPATSTLGNSIDPRGYPSYPTDGIINLVWDGGLTGEVVVSAAGLGGTVAVLSESTGHATNNRRTCKVTPAAGDTAYSPAFRVQIYSLKCVVDDDDAGRMTYAGNWTQAADPTLWNGTYHRNDGASASTATYNFGALPAGTYNFLVSYQGGAGNTHAASFKVYDGSTLLGGDTYDQTAPVYPATTNSDGNAVAHNFDRLGTFAVSGANPITVVVRGGSDGYTTVDAISWQLATTLAAPVAPVTNLRLYDSFIADPLNPPLFHPQLLNKLQGCKVIRSMNMLNANSSGVVAYTDFSPTTMLNFASSNALTRSYSIVAVQPWSDPTGFWTGSGCVLVTMDESHGLPAGLPFAKGQTVSLRMNPPYQAAFYTGGAGLELDALECAVQYDARYMAPNQFAIGRYIPNLATAGTIVPLTLQGADTSMGIAIVNLGGTPPVYYYQMVGAVPGCAAWLNVPIAASDACIDQLLTDFADNCAPGTPLWVECGNEPWNFSAGYTGFGYGVGLANEAGRPGNGIYGHAIRAAQIHARCRTTLAGLGRASALRAVVNVHVIEAGQAAVVAAYYQSVGQVLDGVAIAPYVNNQPSFEPSLTAVYETLNSAQLADALAVSISQGVNGGYVTAMYQALAPYFPQAQVVCYEGGFGTGELGGSPLTQALQSQAVSHDPGLYDVALGYFKQLEAAGCTLYNYFTFSADYIPEGGTVYDRTYGVYNGLLTLPGRGDGSDGLYDNRPGIAGAPPAVIDLSKAVSVVGGAIQAWGALATAPVAFTPPPRKHPQRFERVRFRTNSRK